VAFMDGVDTIVSIVAGVAGIASFVFILIDRRKHPAAPALQRDSAELPATVDHAPDAVADRRQRQRSGVRRLLLSPIVFLAGFLGAGLLAAVVDDTTDEIDLSAIAGWSVATSVTLAWVYFAVKASRTANRVSDGKRSSAGSSDLV
jgi:hypothetical protein